MIKALRQINALEWIRGGSADFLYSSFFFIEATLPIRCLINYFRSPLIKALS